MNKEESSDLKPSQAELLIQRSFDCEDVPPGSQLEKLNLTGPQVISKISSLSRIRSLILLSESDIPSPPSTIFKNALREISEGKLEASKSNGPVMSRRLKPINISRVIIFAASLVLFFGLGFIVSLAVRGPLILDASRNSNQIRKDFIRKIDKKAREMEGLVK